jgi:N-acetylmuramoyl-L-alanine amidase
MKKILKLRYIVIHHSQRKNNNTLSSIKKAHLSRGFEDIGYHYLITKTGKILKGRYERFQGAHVLNQNKNSLGICLTGNFDVQKLNKK